MSFDIGTFPLCRNVHVDGNTSIVPRSGETCKSKVGNVLIWPGGFTHKHRGNPPLKGEKIYATGWFETQEKIGEGSDVY